MSAHDTETNGIMGSSRGDSDAAAFRLSRTTAARVAACAVSSAHNRRLSGGPVRGPGSDQQETETNYDKEDRAGFRSGVRRQNGG